MREPHAAQQHEHALEQHCARGLCLHFDRVARFVGLVAFAGAQMRAQWRVQLWVWYSQD